MNCTEMRGVEKMFERPLENIELTDLEKLEIEIEAKLFASEIRAKIGILIIQVTA